MGGGSKSPDHTESSRSESVDGSSGSPDADLRFTEPSSEAQEQINVFIGNSQTETGDRSSTEGGADVRGGEEPEMRENPPLESDRRDGGNTGAGTETAVSTSGAETDSNEVGGGGVSPDDFTVDVASGVAEARNAGEFSRATFTEGALSERAQSESDEWGVDSAAETGTGRYGSWEQFRQSNITRRSPLSDTDDRGGVTENYMEVADMSGDRTDSYRAYITQYSHSRGPEDWQAQSQMTASTFAHACGVRAPNHTYDPNEEYIAAAGVNRIERPEAEPVAVIDQEKASKVDRGEFLDICAVQQLAGNKDLHFENVFVDEEGGVHCIDYDRATKEYPDMASLESGCHKAKSTANHIDRHRNTDLNIDKADIADRAQEIAVCLEVSGQKERVLQSISEYDKLFPDTDKQHAEVIRHNINIAVDAARRE